MSWCSVNRIGTIALMGLLLILNHFIDHDVVHRIQARLDVLSIESTASLHAEGVQYAYVDHAMKIQQSRLRHNEILGPQPICDLLIMIPTGYRVTLGENGYRYVEDTIASLRNMKAVNHGILSKICVLVLNNSPNAHPARFEAVKQFRTPMCGDCKAGVVEGASPLDADGSCHEWCSGDKHCGTSGAYQGLGAVMCQFSSDEKYDTKYLTSNMTHCSVGGCRGGPVNLTNGRCDAWCTDGVCGNTEHDQEHGTDCRKVAQLDIRFIGQTNYEDPFGTAFSLPADGLVGSASNTRKQGMHLSHGLLEASRWEAKYLLLMEDDMSVCSPDTLAALDEAITLTEHTSERAGIDWSVLRVGFGGNGVIIHWKDAVILGKYILDHLGRRPIDWLIPEWGASMTYSAQIVNNLRQREMFTYRDNLFKHMGRSSSFSNRAWNEGEQASLPTCFGPNFFLRPEEQFNDPRCHGQKISPCYCEETNSLCH